MIRKFKIQSRIHILAEKEGISIEEQMRKVTQSKEPIENVAPLIYTERKDGVLPQYDHRTDRWKMAQDMMNHVHASKTARRKQNEAKILEEAAKEAAKTEKINTETPTT